MPCSRCSVGAAATPASAAVRGSVPLTEGWEFADEPKGPWRAVTVPHVMDPNPTAAVWPGRVAWYRLRFTGPADAARAAAWALRFGQVRRRAQVFLNGEEIGRNADPYTPFVLPADGLDAGQGEHARRPRRQPAHAGLARGLVELGRDHARRSTSSRAGAWS